MEGAQISFDSLDGEVGDFNQEADEHCYPTTIVDYIENTQHLRKVFLEPYDEVKGLISQTIDPVKKEFDQTYQRVKDDFHRQWKEYKLEYLGLIFNIPRFFCLLVVLFGCFMAFCHTCQMQVIVEPRKIVDIYEKVALFSMFWVLGSIMTLYTLLTTFNIPFCHLYVQFGHGFVYDVVADCILLATRTGMRNEFFFAIPKRQTTVTFSIPGVTIGGPNIPNQIMT